MEIVETKTFRIYVDKNIEKEEAIKKISEYFKQSGYQILDTLLYNEGVLNNTFEVKVQLPWTKQIWNTY